MSAPSPRRSPIRPLAREVVEQIAAGEVVERPASVVKELVENALDAGATRIEVTLTRGGLDAIRVDDDGIGIPASELAWAVAPHATSKIPPEGPIDRIETLGFRGEALSAIATVARLSLLSRPPDAEAAAALEVRDGANGPIRPGARAPGTTVEVLDLFGRTPARRKFLKSAATEQVEVLRTLERLYLARPDVALRLRGADEELAEWPAATGLTEAAARVLGPEMLRDSFAVAGELPQGVVRGVIGGPGRAASSSRRLFLSVNGRAVESRPLVQAVRAAFGDALPRSRYPVGVLHLEIDPGRLDVNVHPTKREVRVSGDRDLAEALRRAVRDALLRTPVGVEASPRDRVIAVGLRAGPSEGATRGSQTRLLEAPTSAGRAVPATPHRPGLSLLGCVDALYWIAESGSGLVLIDQHAASERLLYDTLRREGALARQELVDPARLRLTGAQQAALRAHADPVRAAGFTVEEFGRQDVTVRSVPEFRGRRAPPEALRDLLDELADGGRPTLPDGLAERAAATIACHAAIRAGDAVSIEEFRHVLEALAELPEPARSCPHGRPIFVELPRSRLDRWFLRSGA